MRTATVALVVIGLGGAALAQEAKPAGGKRLEQPPPVKATRTEATAGTSEKKLAQPEGEPPAAGPWLVHAARPQTASGPGAVPLDDPLKGVSALSSQPAEIRLLFPDGERTLRRGDRLGTDLVRAAGDGLLVLERSPMAGLPGGAALVVVRFDAAGQPRMRVYQVEDPTPVNPPEVR
jgi:hypothetical protein